MIVVIGASLGGLDALEVLLAGLPADFPPAVAVVQHRGKDPNGELCAHLSAHSRLPLSRATDKEPIGGGRVYVAPPDYHLLVGAGAFHLSTEAPVNHSRPSVDVLFESAASSYGAAVVGVILTGASEDGADGAERISAAGGRVLVQDPGTAASPTMPHSALPHAFRVLPLEQMASALVELCVGRRAQ